MLKTPGICRHQDDMPDLMLRLREADLLVCATPLYVFSIPGLMNDFMDRQFPMAQPFIDIKDGICTHPLRYPSTKSKAVVLISTCGFPDTEHFSGLKETWHTLFRSGRRANGGDDLLCRWINVAASRSQECHPVVSGRGAKSGAGGSGNGLHCRWNVDHTRSPACQRQGTVRQTRQCLL